MANPSTDSSNQVPGTAENQLTPDGKKRLEWTEIQMVNRVRDSSNRIPQMAENQQTADTKESPGQTPRHFDEGSYKSSTSDSPTESPGQTSRHGIIHFDERSYKSSTRDSPCMYIDSKSSMEHVWSFLTDKNHWALPRPNLLISLTGGAQAFAAMQHRLKELIKRDIVSAATKTGAWIITGGMASGVMKLVGKAVRDYYIENPEKKDLVALGIASWGFTADRNSIEKSWKTGRPACYRYKKADDSKSPLDHNHTHFLLIDDGSVDEPGGEIEFRSNLEKYIHEGPPCPSKGHGKSKHQSPRKESEKENQGGATETEKKIALVLLVVEGGYNTLKTVRDSVKSGCPIVVVAGSGRAADYIAEAFRLTSQGENSDEKMRKNAEALIGQAEAEKYDEAVTTLKECLDHKKLFIIFNLDKESSGKNICTAIMLAVLKNPEPSIDRLKLALAWNQFKLAKKEICSMKQEDKTPKELKPMFTIALLDDQVDFVELFLDHGIKLKRFLDTDDDLSQLYVKGLERKDMIAPLLTRRGLKDRVSSSEKMLKYINRLVIHVLQDDSFTLYPGYRKPNCLTPTRELFLWSILFNRRKLSRLFWERGHHYLDAALFAVALLKRLSERAKKRDRVELSKDLEQHAAEWEELAVRVLSECYSDDPEKTHKLLVRESSPGQQTATNRSANRETCHPGKQTATADSANWPSLLNVAELFRIMKFAEHSACQTKLSEIWFGHMSQSTCILKILLCILIPIVIPLLIEKKTNKTSKVSPIQNNSHNATPVRKLGLCDIKKFYDAPVTKFYANILFYLVYLVLFSYFVLIELDAGQLPTYVEIATWVWVVNMITEECRQLLDQRRHHMLYTIKRWLKDPWNRTDLCMYLFFIISIVLRFVLPMHDLDFRWARAFYSFTLVLFFLRTLQFFFVQESIGPKVIMIQKMVVDVALILFIFLVFLISFGLAYHANMFPKAPIHYSILANIIYLPYFQIYGDLDYLEQMKGADDSSCEHNETVWRENPFLRCPVENRFVMSFLVGIYLIVTNIMLVNLLIAMFSNTYHKVQQMSDEVWRFYRLSLIHEYCDRPFFVAPLIVLSHVYRTIRYSCSCDRMFDRCKRWKPFSVELKQEEHEVLDVFERKAMRRSTKPPATREEEQAWWEEMEDSQVQSWERLKKIVKNKAFQAFIQKEPGPGESEA